MPRRSSQPNTPQHVLAVDIGNHLGLALARFDQTFSVEHAPTGQPVGLRHWTARVMPPTPDTPTGHRPALVYDALKPIFEAGVAVVLYENVVFHVSAYAAQAHGEIRGVLFLLAHQFHVPLVGFNVKTVKKSLAGHGAATKLEMQRAAQARYKLPDLPDDDEADALGVLAAWQDGQHTSAAYEVRKRHREAARKRRDKVRKQADVAQALTGIRPAF